MAKEFLIVEIFYIGRIIPKNEVGVRKKLREIYFGFFTSTK